MYNIHISGHSRAFRFTHPMRTGMRSFSVLNPATRTPTVITVPSLGNAGNRMPTFMASSGEYWVLVVIFYYY